VAYPIGIQNKTPYSKRFNMKQDWYGGMNICRYKRFTFKSAIVDAKFWGELSGDAKVTVYTKVFRENYITHGMLPRRYHLDQAEGQDKTFFGRPK